MKPQRIQRKRTKGWRKPDDAIIVSRPSKYGNPYIVASVKNEDESSPFNVFHPTAKEAVEAYERMLIEWKRLMPDNFAKWIAPLRGKDLCCYCPTSEGTYCHADVLLRYANEGVEDE